MFKEEKNLIIQNKRKKNMAYKKELLKHYSLNWLNNYEEKTWNFGPVYELSDDFSILVFKPREKRNMWTYATCCMSNKNYPKPIEIHIFSETQDEKLLELLTIVAHYHQNKANLGLNHTVNFGKPWQLSSRCKYGLISLPYLDGPKLEILEIGNISIRILWLIPITKEEVDYKKTFGIEALEGKFDENGLDFLNSNRQSVV